MGRATAQHKPCLPRPAACAAFFLPALLLATSSAATARADEPLHVRIDREFAANHPGPVSAPAGDAEFLRRATLDLNGTITSAAEARAFLDDKSPDKRTALVDRLLNTPRYALHFANVFDVMLMERRSGESVKPAEWEAYLQASFAQNKPWDQLAREILNADGVDPQQRGAARFYLERNGEPNLLTRDVGRIFFGRDMQCAQCHNHPSIGAYLQSDYHGLFAYFSRSFVFTDKDKKTFMAEKAEGSVIFQSVFDPEKTKYNTRPKVPGGVEIDEPFFAVGEDYAVPAADNVRPVPKYSRRGRIADEAIASGNAAFRKNIVNRLWAHMMGRGLVEPVDLHHPDNPPTHPALLELLATEFAGMKYDIKAFLRELALTAAYQRSVEPPANVAELAQRAAERLPGLDAEKVRLKTELAQLEPALAKLEADLTPLKKAADKIREELDKSNTATADAKKSADTAAQALAKTQTELAAKQDVAKLLAEAAAKAKEAASKLPAEKELATAAAKFQARADSTAAEAAALAKTVEQQAPPAKSTGDALAAAQRASREVAAKLDAAQAPLKPLGRQFADLEDKRKSLETAVNALDNTIATERACTEYVRLLAAVPESQQKIEAAKTQLAEAKRAVEAAAAEALKRQTESGPALAVADEAAKVLAAARQDFAVREETVKVIAEASTKTEAARQKLPQDAELVLAAQKLKARADQLTSELEATRPALAEKEQLAQTAAAKGAAARKSIEEAIAQTSARQQQAAQCDAAVQKAVENSHAASAAVELAKTDLTKRWTDKLTVGMLRPLSPEQLAWSTMRAAGIVDQQRAAVEAELNQKQPINAADANPNIQAQRAAQVERDVFAKLAGNVSRFAGLFGGGAGQPQRDFFATVDQALFFANGGELRSWLSPGAGNLTERLAKLNDAKTLAEELYLSLLTRRPSETEVADIEAYLAARTKDRPAAVQEIAWGLVTSTEFRFNH